MTLENINEIRKASVETFNMGQSFVMYTNTGDIKHIPFAEMFGKLREINSKLPEVYQDKDINLFEKHERNGKSV